MAVRPSIPARVAWLGLAHGAPGPSAVRPPRWPVSTSWPRFLLSGGGWSVPMLWCWCTSGRKSADDGAAGVVLLRPIGSVLPMHAWGGVCLLLPASRRLAFLWDQVVVMVALTGPPRCSRGGLGMCRPSTTGAAHRCRRPSLGYPTPFDCAWSRQHIALGFAGGTPVSSHGLGYPTPFDRAGTPLGVLLEVSKYSTTCSLGPPARGKSIQAALLPLLDLPPLMGKFEKVDAMFKAALFSILGDNIVDPYMAFDHGKDAWDALEAKFGVSDAGTELYVMEQYYDYRMTDERSMVEQAHEIQSLAKELEQFKCTLPDKFVAGGIIAKLPPSWRNFATSLKHKRQEFSVSDLIGSLHVEEKARAKDTRARSFEGGSSANVVQKINFQSHKSKNKNNGKCKFDEKNKASNSTNFKRKTPYKKKGNYHVCGAPGHWAPDCPERHDRRGNNGKSANVVIGVDTEMKDVGYGRKDFLRADGKRLTCFVRGVEHFENPMEDDNEAPKRSKRQRTAKSFGHDFMVYLVDDTPTSISEAYASLDADYWKEAVRSEMDSILANGTWEVTNRPYGCKPVGCKLALRRDYWYDVVFGHEFLHTDNFFPDLSDFFDNLNMGDAAVTRCSGGDGGDDDDNGDGDDVQLDDDDDGIDFPLRRNFPADSCPPESSFLSGVLRPQRRP
ncbi:hypothetical protein QYE76_022282 [Lolium multiflorum]|uniref:Retrotransposon protein, putative, Ty1-copia subclass n=1 Tax=Lolium multiflorum TaxID=4521 RepID=A0AAD8R9P1_LOLMU|nr:hypothetical protein QYE76_022282 [Lolium multiflorum]